MTYPEPDRLLLLRSLLLDLLDLLLCSLDLDRLLLSLSLSTSRSSNISNSGNFYRFINTLPLLSSPMFTTFHVDDLLACLCVGRYPQKNSLYVNNRVNSLIPELFAMHCLPPSSLALIKNQNGV